MLHKLGPEINQVLGQLKLHSKSEGQSGVSGVQAKKKKKIRKDKGVRKRMLTCGEQGSRGRQTDREGGTSKSGSGLI